MTPAEVTAADNNTVNVTVSHFMAATGGNTERRGMLIKAMQATHSSMTGFWLSGNTLDSINVVTLR